jgi:hypothetical protein
VTLNTKVPFEPGATEVAVCGTRTLTLFATQAGNGALPPMGQHGTSEASVGVPRTHVFVPVFVHVTWRLPVWPTFSVGVAD